VTIGAAVLVALLASQVHDTRTPPETASASISGLPKRLAHDGKRLFTTKTPALVMAAGGAAAFAVHPADHQSVRSLSMSGGLEEFLDGGADTGDGTVQGLSAIGVYAAGYALGSERTKEVGTSLVEAQIVNLFITTGVKYAVDRERPNGGRYSFPSGHSSATFATADVLAQEFGWQIGAPAYAGAVYVAISRLAEKQHYLSDVVFGAAVGIASARTLDVSTHGRRFRVTAVPVPGGAALVVHETAR
jgi:acid phosphatase family membrane protein YuiD